MNGGGRCISPVTVPVGEFHHHWHDLSRRIVLQNSYKRIYDFQFLLVKYLAYPRVIKQHDMNRRLHLSPLVLLYHDLTESFTLESVYSLKKAHFFTCNMKMRKKPGFHQQLAFRKGRY